MANTSVKIIVNTSTSFNIPAQLRGDKILTINSLVLSPNNINIAHESNTSVNILV